MIWWPIPPPGRRKVTLKNLVPFSVAVLLVLLSGRLRAQDRTPAVRYKNWDVSFWVAGATGEENTNSFSEAQILSAAFSLGKSLTGEIGDGWKRGDLEYTFNIIPLFVQFTPQRIYGIGFEPLALRWNSSLHTSRVSPFIELAGGGLHTNTNLPAGDTSDFNFTARGGGGIQIVLTERQALDLACDWWHISNANLGDRNPEFNGIHVRLGYHWFK